MPDKMTIRIKVEPIDATTGQTRSMFVIEEKGFVTFRNDAGKMATVKFEGTSPFCQGSTTEPSSFDIPAGGTSPRKVCKDIADREFKYTATVLDAQPEDPILIIERAPPSNGHEMNPIIWVESLVPLVIGLILGVIGGIAYARRRGMRRP